MGNRDGTVPAGRVSRSAMADLRTGEIPSLMDVESRILTYSDELAEITEQLYTVSRQRADAESAWKEHRGRIAVLIADSGARSSEDVREGEARERVNREGIRGDDLYRTYKIQEALEESVKQHQRSLQSQLSALQTIVRGLRQVTGLEP